MYLTRMFTNITSIISHYIESVNRTLVTNDLNGAIIFIIVVLVWYSSSIVFLLGMQMKTSKETSDELTNRSTKLFEHSFRDLTNNKEILEWSSDTSLTRLNSRRRPRRRSSLDYQILDEWKILSDELKTHENWPWAIRKLIIRRNLRRHQHTSECGSAP
ncbi:unnamed protein product [Rotaria socialis]|uniref:Uncharacterized protein n=1 Tax=Rotaria socialis TaxID=392032 RepID=A0A820ZND4_9BILA|nr:unnamed protein product [Rotaria socialis]